MSECMKTVAKINADNSSYTGPDISCHSYAGLGYRLKWNSEEDCEQGIKAMMAVLDPPATSTITTTTTTGTSTTTDTNTTTTTDTTTTTTGTTTTGTDIPAEKVDQDGKTNIEGVGTDADATYCAGLGADPADCNTITADDCGTIRFGGSVTATCPLLCVCGGSSGIGIEMVDDEPPAKSKSSAGLIVPVVLVVLLVLAVGCWWFFVGQHRNSRQDNNGDLGEHGPVAIEMMNNPMRSLANNVYDAGVNSNANRNTVSATAASPVPGGAAASTIVYAVPLEDGRLVAPRTPNPMYQSADGPPNAEC